LVENIISLRNRLQLLLNQHRFDHSLRVEQQSIDLACMHGVDQGRAALAGLLHDVARNLNAEQLVVSAKKAKLLLCDADIKTPLLLHAPVGALILKNDWGIDDQEVLDAVSQHTVAAVNMSDLAKVVYLADMIEPGRDCWRGLEQLRKVSAEDLNAAMLLALENVFDYLQQKNRNIHPSSYAAYEYFKRLQRDRNKLTNGGNVIGC